MMKEQLYIFLLLFLTKLVSSAPKTWPYMKSHDIWGGDTNNNTIDTVKNRSNSNSFRNFMNIEDDKIVSSRKRKAKGECNFFLKKYFKFKNVKQKNLFFFTKLLN